VGTRGGGEGRKKVQKKQCCEKNGKKIFFASHRQPVTWSGNMNFHDKNQREALHTLVKIMEAIQTKERKRKGDDVIIDEK